MSGSPTATCVWTPLLAPAGTQTTAALAGRAVADAAHTEAEAARAVADTQRDAALRDADAARADAGRADAGRAEFAHQEEHAARLADDAAREQVMQASERRDRGRRRP